MSRFSSKDIVVLLLFSTDHINDLIKSITNTNQLYSCPVKLSFYALSSSKFASSSKCICIEIIRCHAREEHDDDDDDAKEKSGRHRENLFYARSFFCSRGRTCISCARRMIVSVTVYERQCNRRNLTLLSSKNILVTVKTSLFSSVSFALLSFFLLFSHCYYDRTHCLRYRIDISTNDFSLSFDDNNNNNQHL